ncbi:MAG: phosphotransferase family protein [Rhodocyclaceae bacterium]|nr:phosphotransferase family protein [Rhodocyclaceae bacterium]
MLMHTLDKNRPTAEWIAQLRQKFPCETTVDRVLTRKLERRAGPPYRQMPLETLIKGVHDLLAAELKEPFELANPRWLVGGASKIHMAFELTWNLAGVGRTTRSMVLRMEPAESTAETSRLREFQIIKAFEGVVPVPDAYWVDDEGKYFPYPALICGFINGVTKPTDLPPDLSSGFGTNFGPVLRPIIGAQFVDCLAKIHTLDWRRADLSTLDAPALGTQAAEWQLNWWERVYAEDMNEDIPLMRLTMAWLRENIPSADHISVIHSDYRAGNFLYTEHDNRISAILDWELGHLGDRHEDLAYTAMPLFGHHIDDGKTFLVGGLMPEDEFFASYEKLSGLSVDRPRIDYYYIMGLYKLVTIALATMRRIASCGKTHHDILMTWLTGVSYPMLELLRVRMEEVI